MTSSGPACSHQASSASAQPWPELESVDVDVDVDSSSELIEESGMSAAGAFLIRHGSVAGRILAVGLVGFALIVCGRGLAGGAHMATRERGNVAASTALAAADGVGSFFNNDALAPPIPAVPSVAPPLLSMKPVENTKDGNVCADDEEEIGRLCYKKCGLLTSGLYPIRTTPWTCCKKRPCGLTNQRMSVAVCDGFDVAGTAEGSGCPHIPGTCLADEEFSLGMCYKKCSILTNGELPYRFSAATCCKAKGLGCIEHFWHSKTRKSFAVGGGKGDGDKSTPSNVHPPLKELTEIATD